LSFCFMFVKGQELFGTLMFQLFLKNSSKIIGNKDDCILIKFIVYNLD
jgi:hypothetical protein